MVAIIHIHSFYPNDPRNIKTELTHVYENAKKYGIQFEKPLSTIPTEHFPVIVKGDYQGYQFEFLIVQTPDYTFSLRGLSPSKIKKDIHGKEGIDLAFYTLIAAQLIEGYAIQHLTSELGDPATYIPPKIDY